jgi:malonate transporter and related proteins
MESIANIVFPVFAIILGGYGAGRLGLLGEYGHETLGRFVYFVAFPVLLFHAMARVEPETIFHWPFLSAYGIGLAATLIFALGVKGLFGGGVSDAGLFGMAAVFGNTGYLGIPLAMTAFGQAGALPAIIVTVLNNAVAMAIIVIIVEVGRNGGKGVLRDVGTALIKNPLVVAPVAGVLWSFSGWGLAAPVDTFCTIVGGAAGPCALFAVGLFLVGKSPTHNAAQVGCVVAIKLIVQPALTWWLVTFVFPMEPLWATVAVLMAALPAGANVFILAQRYGLFVRRASAAILVSTALSVVTLSGLFLLLPK